MPFSRTLAAVLAAACFTLVTSGTRADEIDELAKKLEAVVSKQKTLQFKSHTTTDMTIGSASNKSTTDATFAYMKKDDKILMRMETKTTGTSRMGDTDQKTESTTLMISDGEYAYMYMESAGMKYATKTRADNHVNPFKLTETWKGMKKMQNFRVLPDETVDGRDCYVVEMTPTDPAMKAIADRTVTHYDKKTGVGIKTVSYDPKGKVTTSSTITDVKVDENIDAARFVFKAPAGVEVVDMTQQQPIQP